MLLKMIFWFVSPSIGDFEKIDVRTHSQQSSCFVGNGGIVNNQLKEKGIFVGHLSIGTMLQSGTAGDPDLIAETWYNMYEKKDRFE